MNRRRVLITGIAALLSGLAATGTAHAAPLADQVARTLQRAGYSDIRIERTLLGRLRATGAAGDKSREIIVDSRTGEVLRDVVLYRDGRKVSSGYHSADEDESEEDSDDDSGRGRGGDDDDDDNDNDNSGNDNDNSGSGSENSGSSGDDD